MKIEFLGHAGIEISVGSTVLAMDAWMSHKGAFDASWFQYPCNHHLIDRDWSRLRAYFISHEHMDHLDVDVLKRLPAEIPIIVPNYGTALLPNKIERLTGRKPERISPGVTHQFGEIQLQVWVEESPMNEDSVWAFKSSQGSVVHFVDSRMNLRQISEIQQFCGGAPDLVLLQCSGASWYPITYSNYTVQEKHEKSVAKRLQKWGYAAHVFEELQPAVTAVVAGPPVFLDPVLQHANKDPSFPHPGESVEWLGGQHPEGLFIAPLPGDIWDVRSRHWSLRGEIADLFDWNDSDRYLQKYAEQVNGTISQVYAEAEGLTSENLFADFLLHFEQMIGRSDYFTSMINMNVVFEIEDLQDAQWLVEFRPGGQVRVATDSDEFGYRYRIHSRWLKRVLLENVPWEDFLLSLRFECEREPDEYNDHLLGLMKFNDRASLRRVEAFEKSLSNETIDVFDDLDRCFRINRYCPHAGASLERAPIHNGKITCLLHHYVFDLESGEAENGKSRLSSKRLA
jgi:UDP-MurNAc hydroxylase